MHELLFTGWDLLGYTFCITAIVYSFFKSDELKEEQDGNA